MKRTDASEPELSAEDRSLVAAIDAAFRPAPMRATRRAELRADLHARLDRGSRAWRWLAPALAGAAALALWLVRPVSVPVPAASRAGSELYAFIEPDAAPDAVGEAGIYLPDDYRAIAALIEDDAKAP